MKKLFTAALCICIAAGISSATAQSAKFAPAMKKTLTELDSAKTADAFQNMSNSFERIGTAEKDQWLPYYYAAYSLLMKSYQEKDKANIDPTMDKADLLLASAEALSANNSEINTLKAMNTQRRMEVDQSRYMTLGPKCTQFIKLAEQQDEANPRAIMFQAQMTYFTPEAFGGSKDKGVELMKKAVALFETMKPKSDMAPSWGKEYAVGTLARWTN